MKKIFKTEQEKEARTFAVAQLQRAQTNVLFERTKTGWQVTYSDEEPPEAAKEPNHKAEENLFRQMAVMFIEKDQNEHVRFYFDATFAPNVSSLWRVESQREVAFTKPKKGLKEK